MIPLIFWLPHNMADYLLVPLTQHENIYGIQFHPEKSHSYGETCYYITLQNYKSCLDLELYQVSLIQDNGLVKTVNFNNPKYVGDPINAVRIFNEKEVDELAIFDIDATLQLTRE